MVAEHREPVAERMRAAGIAENASRADDHRGKQDDEPENDDHEALQIEAAGRQAAGAQAPGFVPVHL